MRHSHDRCLKVLLAYGSLHIGARINSYLLKLQQVDVVGQARNAGEAIALAAEEKPQLLIADLYLTHGTGLDLLRTVKGLPSPPYVVMTSDSQFAQDRRECIKMGADAFVHLPREIDDLVEIIRLLAKGALQ